MKNRFIVPLKKPNKPETESTSYRPISLTSYFAKILEKILCYRLVNYIIKLRLLSSSNFAYLKARSTQDAVTFIVDSITRQRTNGQDTFAVFFDFSAAFDCVRPNVLRWKLENEFFISGFFLRFVINFFDDRFSAVILGTLQSDWRLDSIGVPQGGSLSPILYIMYTDGLCLLNEVYGIGFNVYADDLCLFTRVADKLTEHRLQWSVWFVQWYSSYLGLNLNMDKTYYQRFGKQLDWDIRLFFDTSMTDRIIYGEAFFLPDDGCFYKPVQKAQGAIKYLGYYLDPDLNFRFHVDKMINQINRSFYSINKRLQHLWRIKAVIAWRILDACVLSIFDYTSIFMCLMDGATRQLLQVKYNMVLRAVCSPLHSTSIHILCQQFGTLTFENRWHQKCVQYFSHLLRVPVSGVLYTMIKKYWWKPIKYCLRFCYRPGILRSTISHFSHLAIDGTLIGSLLSIVVESRYTDTKFFTRSLKYDDITRKISHYIDYTVPWKKVRVITAKYEETDDVKRIFTSNRLVIFTDGSVKRLHGGYGVFIMNWMQYMRCQRFYSEEELFQQIPHDPFEGDNILYARQIPLSQRTSIDYCEALAICEALCWIAEKCKEYLDRWNRGRPGFLRGIKYLHIITDSKVVLSWIQGKYRISNAWIKVIIDDIHWNYSWLMDFGFTILFQWTASHEGVYGNEIADLLAKRGMEKVQLKIDSVSDRFDDASNWRNITPSSINRLIKRDFYKKQYKQYLSKISQTTFGVFYQTNVISNECLQFEMKHLNRIELKWLLAIRTGHNRFKHFQFTRFGKGEDGYCDLCMPISNHVLGYRQYSQTVSHLLINCNHEYISYSREFLRKEIWTYYHEFYEDLDDQQQDEWDAIDVLVDWGIMTTYFNPLIDDMELRLRIIKTAICFIAGIYRVCVNRNETL